MSYARLSLILTLILLGILTRLLPHPPNFTAMSAIALFGASTIGSLGLSFFIVFIAMFLSDLVFGMHNSMPYVYFSFGLTVLMGHWLNLKTAVQGDKVKRTIFTVPMCLTASSFLFFFIANFGVWMAGDLYTKTWDGLLLCYIAAIPFLKYQILGDLFYGCLMFVCFVSRARESSSLPQALVRNR